MRAPALVTLAFILCLGFLPFVLGQTCSKTEKCEQGCCNKSGNCGFGPDFCDDDVCVSTCDAKAECGKYAPEGKEHCPLNVCCSQFGYCGTTPEFCDDDCQNGCDPVDRPQCSGTSSTKRYAGYYGSWCVDRPCDVLQPSNINAPAWSHLYYSFALVDPTSFKITTMHSRDSEFYTKFAGLKKKSPSVKTYIAVGGWDAGGKVFSDMARFPGARKSFIQSVVDFLEEYDFDGIDLDWEYPAAEDREGSPEDTKNYVSLVKELKAALGSDYGLSVAIPASYWYLRGFDLPGMAKYVDWFNFMSYDIHGVWDGDSPFTRRVINPHTNLTEISDGLDLLWRNSIPPSKVMLGLGFYGRSFTLSDPSCNTPGCPFAGTGGGSGGAEPGSCTGVSGTLSNYEIERILKHQSPERVYDKDAGVNWLTWNSDQWVSFDDSRTLRQKADFANSRCLSGLFAWSVDLGGPGTLGNPNNFDPDSTDTGGADPDGSGITDGGSGDVYISPEIYDKKDPVISCYPPCNLIFPPFDLGSTTTISLPPWTTSLAVGWSTTSTTTLSDGSVSTSTGYTRTTQTTTLILPPVTTTAIDVWNYVIKSTDKRSSTYQLTTSLVPPPLTITNDPNPTSEPGVTHPPVTRTITPPPYPHTTSISDNTELPTISIDIGPPGPLCKTGCGSKCRIFCSGPCGLFCPGVDGGGGNGFDDPKDPDRPRPTPIDPTDPKKDPCNPEFDSSSGKCPTGNTPIWDPSTLSVRCDVPDSMVDSTKSSCQQYIEDNFSDSEQEIEDAQQCCKNPGGGSLFARQNPAPACPEPGQRYFETTPPENGQCHATFTCDFNKWPNVCANARSAIVKRGMTSILTYLGRRDVEVTHLWYNGKFGSSGGPANGKEGWELIDCNVEEYPFSSGDPERNRDLQIWDQQPVVRLVPKEENSQHAVKLRQFYTDSAKEAGVHSYDGLKYCMDFINHPTGTSEDDFFLGKDTSKNICAEPYGNEFLLVNKLQMRRNQRTHDPWWDDKLFEHVIFPGKRTADLPSQYCQHPSPGKKTHINGAWTTEGVGSKVDRMPNRYYSCDNYPGYSGPAKREARGRRHVKDYQSDNVPEPERNSTQSTDDMGNQCDTETGSCALRYETDDVNLVARKAAAQGGFLSPDAYAFLGCADFDGDDPCSWDPTCGAPPDSGDEPGVPQPTGFVGRKRAHAGWLNRYNRDLHHERIRRATEDES